MFVCWGAYSVSLSIALLARHASIVVESRASCSDVHKQYSPLNNSSNNNHAITTQEQQ